MSSADQIEAQKHYRERARRVANDLGYQREWDGKFRDAINQRRLFYEGIARSNQFAPNMVAETFRAIERELANSPVGTSSFEIGVLGLINRNIAEIELTCRRLNLPIRAQRVVAGISDRPGINADTSPSVVEPTISVIRVTMPFFPFHNAISKLLAKTLLFNGPTLVCDPFLIRTNLRTNPHLISEWVTLIAAYAVNDHQQPMYFQPPEGATALRARTEILSAVDLFAVAHEYGHHTLHRYRLFEDIQEEYKADCFAQYISHFSARNRQPCNFFSLTGGGAVVCLCGPDLVLRAKSVLQTGHFESQPSSSSHPPTVSRINTLDTLDYNFSPREIESVRDFRRFILEIFQIIWTAVFPRLHQLHLEGIRPIKASQNGHAWLPW